MADLFLSYAKADQQRAAKVAEYLEACGWDVFWDAKIRARDDWRQKLETELASAACVTVLWSRHSINSSWVKDEADIASRRGVCLSVMIESITPPLGFGTHQAINLANWYGGSHPKLVELRDAASEVIGRPPLVEDPRVPGRSGWRNPRLQGVAALIVVGALAWPLNKWLSPDPWVNQEIVLDASIGMGEEFADGASRLDAAQEALGRLLLHPDDNLALRSFGAPCFEDAASELLVPFGTSRRERIEAAATSLRPHEQPTLAAAVISALSDVAEFETSRRIVVLAGHADGCVENDIAEIKNHLTALEEKGRSVDYEFRLVAMKPSTADSRRMRAIANALAGDFYTVVNVEELERVLRHVLIFEPSMAHVDALWEIVSGVAQLQNRLVGHLNSRHYDEAEEVLASGLAAHARQEQPFSRLAARRVAPDFERFYSLAAENRTLQIQAFDAAHDWIEAGHQGADVPTVNARIAVWNEAIRAYNANHREMQELTTTMAEEARNRAVTGAEL